MHWRNDHPEVDELLNDLLQRVEGILGNQFIGMYLYGSLATGDYVARRSDVDFVVVTRSQLPELIVDNLGQMHATLGASGPPLAKKLEGAYVPRSVIRRHHHGHPEVPTINEGNFYLAPLGADWVIQRAVIREYDSRFAGPPAAEIIDPIQNEDINTAILSAIDGWWTPMLSDSSSLERPGYQPFAVLSMCRALYSIEEGNLASKEDAAKWALERVRARWHDLIEHALAWREGDEIESIEETVMFMDEMIRLCRKGA